MNPNLQQQLLEIENLATQQYMHANPAATAALSSFRTSSECIPQSRLILDHSSNPHALYLAADSLGELLPNYFHTFTGAQTLEIRNYLLNWLASAVLGQRVTHDYVLRKMCTTIALFSKIAWRQDPNAPAGQMSAVSADGSEMPISAPIRGGHSDFVNTCQTFFGQPSLRLHCVGLWLLIALVAEMEKVHPVETPSDHRKTTRLFRDHSLLDVCKIALNELRTMASVQANVEPKLVSTCLDCAFTLFSATTSYDFIGSAMDESSSDDSNITLQLPSSWRTIIEDTSPNAPLQMFAMIFTTYATRMLEAVNSNNADMMDAARQVMSECLNAITAICSVRRSLFTNDDTRIRFMQAMMETQMQLIRTYASVPKNIAGNEGGANAPVANVPTQQQRLLLDDSRLMHEFVRFLARFKYNFALNDLVRSPSFEPWLTSLYMFTLVDQFEFIDDPDRQNSVSFILGVWSRLASDVPQLKMSDGSSAHTIVNQQLLSPQTAVTNPTATHKIQDMLLELIPKIADFFIKARLLSMNAILMSELKDGDSDSLSSCLADLFAESHLAEQLKHLAVLCRFYYTNSKSLLKSVWDPLASQYTALLCMMLGVAPPPGSNLAMQPSPGLFFITECQLSYLLYVIGSIIGCERTLLLLTQSGQAHPYSNQYPWASNNMVQRDYMELTDAELISWVLNMLPSLNKRTETSNPSAATAAQNMAASPLASTNTFTLSHTHMALAVLYFFNEHRKKHLNSLTSHQSLDTYSSSTRVSVGMYGMSGVMQFTEAFDMGDSSSSPPSPSSSSPSSQAQGDSMIVPTPDSIGHGPAANIWSRTAFFLNKPCTPRMYLQLLVHQLLTYLNYCSNEEHIVRDSLDLFECLSNNYAISGSLPQLDDIQTFLNNNRAAVLGMQVSTTHGNAQVQSSAKSVSGGGSAASSFSVTDIRFLSSTQHPHLIKQFYSIMSRLIFKSSNIEQFPQFIAPFTNQLQQFGSVNNMRELPPALLDQLILLMHKLHGIVLPIVSMVVYNVFFEWFFENNQFANLVLRMVETWWDTPRILHPILGFYAELIHNRSQRIRFDHNSAHGIILFHETNKIVSVYANRILMISNSSDGQGGGSSGAAVKASNELYTARIKGIGKVLKMMTHTLSGNYCNFGIMNYYKDNSLRELLRLILNLIGSIRFVTLLQHPKVAGHYYSFIEQVCRSHLELLVDLCAGPTSTKFNTLMQSLLDGMLSVHQNQIFAASNSIDHMVKLLFDWRLKAARQNRPPTVLLRLEQAFTQAKPIMTEIFCSLLNIQCFDTQDQAWVLSRPILGLLLCFGRDSLSVYQQRLLASQSLPPNMAAETNAKIGAAFDKLVMNLEASLDHLHRDQFQSRLSEFKIAINAVCARPC